ncbi:Variant-specific surface protein [Giardia duodenalis]|uniref:Variant-specific surface protein n=1 Tax=Giardia intestinalis TaxID=5741 RepID=V6T8M4_GIAIN|nr:Variant-specific surface protein [Giardia intestinalis]
MPYNKLRETSMLLIAFYLILSTFAIACKNSGNSCEVGQCDTIGDTEICMQCNQGKVPINGICTAIQPDAAPNCKKAGGGELDQNAQVCGQCTGAYFLYKGGCYNSAQGVGAKLCTRAEQGVCKAPAAGYFIPPDAIAKDQSIMSCGDTTELVLVSNKKKYKGVAFCSACTPPPSAENTATAAVAACSACQSGYNLVQGENVCKRSDGCTIPGCKTCSSDKKTCEVCEDQKISAPSKEACLEGCPAGSYESNKKCAPCHVSCSSCSDGNSNSCTACYPGFVLNREADDNKGTCVPECTGKYMENCAEGQCDGVVGGSKYCKKCITNFAPVDGICVPTNSAMKKATGCTAGDGVCNSCTGEYFLQTNGCYRSAMFPGNIVCNNAQDGKCKKCANEQQPEGNTGSCPACPENCEKCNGVDNQKVCTNCLPGYYLDGNKACKKCSENSNYIIGNSNCVSCAAPSTGSGSILCYVMKSDNGTNNKSGLSIGAIAGISVAVVVVVGGLVGFLCWWFICRGKA